MLRVTVYVLGGEVGADALIPLSTLISVPQCQAGTPPASSTSTRGRRASQAHRHREGVPGVQARCPATSAATLQALARTSRRRSRELLPRCSQPRYRYRGRRRRRTGSSEWRGSLRPPSATSDLASSDTRPEPVMTASKRMEKRSRISSTYQRGACVTSPTRIP